MTPQARAIWDALEFRMPAVLAAVAGLTDAELSWQPPNGANSIGWLLWHIAERASKPRITACQRRSPRRHVRPHEGLRVPAVPGLSVPELICGQVRKRVEGKYRRTWTAGTTGAVGGSRSRCLVRTRRRRALPGNR
jgi:hypothetical protein